MAIGETPFFLAFGTKAAIPVEIVHPSPRILAHLHNLQNKQRVARYYNLKVKTRTFKVEDWVIPPSIGL